jgi:hypothetical protein
MLFYVVQTKSTEVFSGFAENLKYQMTTSQVTTRQMKTSQMTTPQKTNTSGDNT